MANDSIAGLGTRDDHVAQTPRFDAGRLTPDEAKLFQAVGRVARIADVLTQSGLPESRAIATLLSLRAKGAVVPARVQKPAASATSPGQDMAMLENVELEEAKKREILELEARLDQVNHFELLGVRPHAPADEVKKAFYEASRKFHPDRFFGKNLGSFRARLEKVFRTLTDAQAVLTDPARRKAYLAEHPEIVDLDSLDLGAPPPGPRVRTAADDARDAERRKRLAKHPYLAKHGRVNEMVARARAHIAKGDFNLAVNDLQLVMQMDERHSEAKALLTEARRANDKKRSQDELAKGLRELDLGDDASALSSFKSAATMDPQNGPAAFEAAKLLWRRSSDPREASGLAQRSVEADPRKVEYRVLWAQLLEAAGMKALAKKQWEEVVRLDPDHVEGKKQVKKIWPF